MDFSCVSPSSAGKCLNFRLGTLQTAAVSKVPLRLHVHLWCPSLGNPVLQNISQMHVKKKIGEQEGGVLLVTCLWLGDVYTVHVYIVIFSLCPAGLGDFWNVSCSSSLNPWHNRRYQQNMRFLSRCIQKASSHIVLSLCVALLIICHGTDIEATIGRQCEDVIFL